MGQDDGATRAPGGAAIAPPSPAGQREPREQAAPGAAPASLLSSNGGNSGTPMKAAAVELELQQLRKDAQESRRWATEVEQSQINSLRTQARLLEEKVALRDRQLDQRREEAKAAIQKQDREFAKQRDALVAKCLELGAKHEDLSPLLAPANDAGDAAAAGPTAAASTADASAVQAELEEARKRIRTLEDEVEEYAANINRLTLREREARNEVGVVRSLLARGGDFYPEVLPVKRMGYVDYDEVKRALEEGRVVKQNSCSQPTVEKALERVRQAILDPSVDVLLRVDGHVVGEERAHVQLRNLASEFGEPLVDLVLAKKREMEQYNSSGNYIVSVLFSKGREMPLDAAVRRLFFAVRKYREALDRKRVSCDIEAEDLERAEDRLGQQEEDDFLFFRSTGPRASALPISASPWSPTASTSASAAAVGGAALPPLPFSSFAAPLSRATPEPRASQQPDGKAGGRASGEGSGGFSSALLDRFVAHILAHKRQAATAQDYRIKAEEFVVMWLQRLPAAARPLEPIGEEEEFHRLYKKHRDVFLDLFKGRRAQTSSERSRNSAVRYMMQYMGLADDNPIFYPWGRAPQSSSGSVASANSAASSTASGASAPKQKKARTETTQAGLAGAEDGEEEEEVLELGRLRLHIGTPLTPALQRAFMTWLINRQECSRVDEAAVQVDVLQRLFRQALAVREFKLWRSGLRAGSEAVEGGPLDLRLAPGSLTDKGTVREVVAEANLKDVIRDEGTPEEQVAMALLSHWLADTGKADALGRAQNGEAYDSEGSSSSDEEGDSEDEEGAFGGGTKRKRKRPSTGGKSSPSFYSPSRRNGLTDGMKIRFINWLLANKDMNRETAEAYAGRLTSLVGKLIGDQQPLGTMEATRAFYERAMPVALKELTPARTPVQKRMCRIWRFFSEFVDAPDKGRDFSIGATPTSGSKSSSKPVSASASASGSGALAPLGGDLKQEMEGGGQGARAFDGVGDKKEEIGA